MNHELIHDALNLMEEDLITEVEKLRTRKKRNRTKWMKWIAVAACFCVIIGGGYKLLLGGMKGEGLKSDSSVDIEESQNDGAAQNSSEISVVLIEILEWKENGFYGEISDIVEDGKDNLKTENSVDIQKYAVGTKVFVNTEEAVVYTKESASVAAEKVEGKVCFPVGNIVQVQFLRAKDIALDNEIILHAESVGYLEE